MEALKNETFRKAKQIIAKYPSVHLLPSPALERDSFLSSLALFYSLRNLGKNVNLLIKSIPEKFKFLVKTEDLQLSEADFLISIKEKGTKLSQIFYQKTKKETNLYLKTTGGELQKENIVLKPLKLKSVLITIGIDDLEKVKSCSKKKNSDAIINIDNQEKNLNYGQVNLLDPNSSSLSEIVFDFLKIIGENLFDENSSNPLLAGILQEVLGFRRKNLDPKVFKKISFLMEKGADYQKIISHLYNLDEESSFELFKRTLNKLEFSLERNFGWVFLKTGDFQETNSTPKNLSFVLGKLTSGIFPFQNFLILWEAKTSPFSIRGVFYSLNKEVVEKIEKFFPGDRKGNGFLFQTKEKDFYKIKQKIWSVL